MEKVITIDGVQYRCTPVEQEQEQKRISGYYISADATISRSVEVPDTPHNYNIFATELQAKSALAMARISQKMANDERFGGVITDEEWNKGRRCYCIARDGDGLYIIDDYYYIYFFLAFHTEEQAKLFLQENEDLVREYYMID